MTIYTPEQLAVILGKHRLWWLSKDGGEKANLGGADLRNANLRGANLGGANLDFLVISFGPFGTIKQMTTYRPDTDECWSGCWKGTLAGLKEIVAKKFEPGSDNALLFAAGILLCETALTIYQSKPCSTTPTE